jgi:uncharacterized protein with HEPN domain
MVKKPTNPEVFLHHILESIESIERFTNKVAQNEFRLNDEKQSAVIRKIEIIGEAVKNIPTDFKKKYPTIPWEEAAGMRNKLIHEYFGVDLFLVWKTIKSDLPKLKTQIQKIIKQQKL